MGTKSDQVGITFGLVGGFKVDLGLEYVRTVNDLTGKVQIGLAVTLSYGAETDVGITAMLSAGHSDTNQNLKDVTGPSTSWNASAGYFLGGEYSQSTSSTTGKTTTGYSVGGDFTWAYARAGSSNNNTFIFDITDVSLKVQQGMAHALKGFSQLSSSLENRPNITIPNTLDVSPPMMHDSLKEFHEGTESFIFTDNTDKSIDTIH